MRTKTYTTEQCLERARLAAGQISSEIRTRQPVNDLSFAAVRMWADRAEWAYKHGGTISSDEFDGLSHRLGQEEGR